MASFRPMAVAAAGLIDGVNPCSFTAIVFFISFLGLQGYKKRMITGTGLAFVEATFLTYIGIGLGLFSFLYKIKSFGIISGVIAILVGLGSIMLGVLSIFDALRFYRTKSVSQISLQMPGVLKKKIQSMITDSYRVKNGTNAQAVKNGMRMVTVALSLGVVISLFETACTGQVYLPTVVYILRTNSGVANALQYLLLYNIMFIVPLIFVFIFSILGARSEKIAEIVKRNLVLVKLLLGLLFFGLGAMLLLPYMPGTLR